MWTCPKCGRIFGKGGQMHSCHKVPLENHFKNKEKAKTIFNALVRKADSQVGPNKIISLPCCIHLFGTYDYLAALPKKDRLEVRFSSETKIESPRVTQNFPVSSKMYKVCLDLNSEKDIDARLLRWIKTSYNLKD